MFGDPRTAVSDQPSDVLQRDTGCRHDRDEAVPHLAGRPVTRWKTGSLDDLSEPPSHVVVVELGTGSRLEDEPVWFPLLARLGCLGVLPKAMSP